MVTSLILINLLNCFLLETFPTYLLTHKKYKLLKIVRFLAQPVLRYELVPVRQQDVQTDDKSLKIVENRQHTRLV